MSTFTIEHLEQSSAVTLAALEEIFAELDRILEPVVRLVVEEVSS